VTAIFSAAVGVLAQTPGPQDEAAMVQLRNRDYASALRLADQALQQAPDDCRMLTVKGLALKDLGKTSDASLAFTKATSVCPQFLPGLEGLAELQYGQHAPEVDGTLKKILAIQPENTTSHAMLAVLEARAGDCAEAVQHFGKAAELVRSSSAAMTEYGSCLLTVGQPEEANNVFQQLLQRQDSPENRLRYAYSCWKAKDYTTASQTLAPLIANPLANPAAVSLAARVAESAGDTPRAVTLLQQAIAAKPEDARNYLIFSEISFNHASYKVGVDMLNAGLQRLPQDARLYVARGVLEVQQSSFDAAMADFRKAHQLDPDLSLAGDAIGIMLDQRHQSAESLTAYAEQAKAHPDDALVQYFYAEALSQSKEITDSNDTAAIQAARRAVALEPDYQPALDLLCQLEFRAGNVAAALELAQKAVARNPEDETAIYQELMAYRTLGKKEEVNQLVARMKQVKEHQQDARTNYQLQEVTRQEGMSPE